MEKCWWDLRVGRPNGFFLILMALSWWITAAKGDTENANIAKALDDVDWVLKSMVAHERMGDNDNAESLLGKQGFVDETDREEKKYE
jgi:uncharacterized membrane protein YukC